MGLALSRDIMLGEHKMQRKGREGGTEGSNLNVRFHIVLLTMKFGSLNYLGG